MRFKPKHIKLFEQFLKDPLIVKSAKKAPYQKMEDPEDDDEEIDDIEIDDDDPDDDPEPDIVDEMKSYFKKRNKRK